MDQLIECMLTVCARFAPNNWTGIVVDTFTGLGNTFTVTLHVALLKIGSETMHVLVVWQQGVCLGPIEV